MNNLLLHPNTKTLIDNFIENPGHGILLVGEKGSGKHTLALNIASELLDVEATKINEFHSVKFLSEDLPVIKIESIRELNSFLKLKMATTSKRKINRLVVIEEASKMGHEAQNALLKLLEEPPSGSCFILTVTDESKLLSTIKSRVISMPILPISKAQSIEYFRKSKFSESDILKAYTISRGRVGLMSSMLSTGNHPIIDDIELAKLVLSKPIGDRLAMVDELAKDKTQVKNLIEALESISHAALNQSSTSNKPQAIKDWHRRLEISTKSNVQLTHNPNLKLLLDNLFISI